MNINCKCQLVYNQARIFFILFFCCAFCPGAMAGAPQQATHSLYEFVSEPIPETFQLEDELREQIVDRALRFIDTRYIYGGISYETGVDCSSFVQLIFSEFGIDLPRTAIAQSASGRRVERRELRKADLVFFRIRGQRIDHVGIYLGNDLFLHANRTGGEVRTGTLSDSFWRKKYVGARRILPN